MADLKEYLLDSGEAKSTESQKEETSRSNWTGSGSGSAKTLYLCAISNTSASGTPSISVNYGAIGSIGRDAQVTFAVPVAAVQGLANGTYGGLCLYESPYNFGSSTYSSCYMRMSGTDSNLKPYLQVVYK